MNSAASIENCEEPLIEPIQWVFSLLETILSLGGIVLNIVVTLVTHNAVPMPYSQRRMLVTTVSCKFQDFPLLFCYIHCATATFLLTLHSLFLRKSPKDKKRITCSESCSVWQSVVIAFCLAVTLIFTAFDEDEDNTAMLKCSYMVLEVAFVIVPLIIALAHPLLLIWYVLPMRDAATRTFPIMLNVLPEYTLVPPQVPSASTSITIAVSPRTEETMSYDDLRGKDESTKSGSKSSKSPPSDAEVPECL
ncbi:unnamed protein product [Caenorhabditis auriculariae]|uniref:Uncharacterized protein n=1 Tax=Caenorhabditis auriculariae TaxID=2777116 RepID=A0A8S1H5R0_9PELO|nr:unnamed protein product [Caenorhabditis auriculariae]